MSAVNEQLETVLGGSRVPAQAPLIPHPMVILREYSRSAVRPGIHDSGYFGSDLSFCYSPTYSDVESRLSKHLMFVVLFSAT